MNATATTWNELEMDEGPVEIDASWLEPIDAPEPPRPGSGGAAGMISQEPSVHAWEAHVAGVTGAALDPVHLYLRSTLPSEEIARPEAEACAAAVLKARCDHHFWRPLIPVGLEGSFHGHFKDLRRCQELLKEHRPPAGSPGLQSAWFTAMRQLSDAFPR